MSAALVRIVSVDGWSLVLGEQDEPLVRDVELGTRLGFARPRDVRKLVERMLSEGILNDSDFRATVARRETLPGKFRSVTEYELTETAALLVIARSETPTAHAITRKVIEVFLAARKGLLSKEAPIASNAARVADNALFRDDMAAWCTMTARALGVRVNRVHGAVRRQFLVAGVYLVPIALWPLVREFLQALSTRRLLLPGSARANLRLVRAASSPQLQLPLSP